MNQKTILIGGAVALVAFFLYERSKNSIVPGTNLTRAQLSGLPPTTAGIVSGVGGIVSGISGILSTFNSQGTASGNGSVTFDSAGDVTGGADATVGPAFGDLSGDSL